MSFCEFFQFIVRDFTRFLIAQGTDSRKPASEINLVFYEILLLKKSETLCNICLYINKEIIQKIINLYDMFGRSVENGLVRVLC